MTGPSPAPATEPKPDIVRLSVPCVPIAQPRQRHRVVQTADRTFVQNYTPARDPVNAFKASLQDAASKAHRGGPIEGPLAARMLLLFPRPGRLRWKTRPMPRCPHASKPDAENVAKAVLDALTGLLWFDDAQVCDLIVKKRYAAGDEPAGVYLEVQRAG